MQTQYVKLTCDFCKTSVTLEAGKPIDKEEMGHWVIVVWASGLQEHYCRTGCAINALQVHSPIVLTDVEQANRHAPK